MSRRLTPVLLTVVGLLAACSGALSDPKEIILRGIEATSELASFHAAATVDGEFSMPGSEGTISLAGTTFEGDINVTDEQAHLSFGVPAFLGLTGELIMLTDGGFVRLSLLGEKWYRMDETSAEPLPSPSADPMDQLRELLDKDGVEATKLDDVACGDRQCYQVQLTIPAEVLRDLEPSPDPLASPGEDPADMIGEALVLTLLFDREDLYLTQLSTSVDDPDSGTFSLTLTLSAFGEPVTISPPPADQVEESGFEFPME